MISIAVIMRRRIRPRPLLVFTKANGARVYASKEALAGIQREACAGSLCHGAIAWSKIDFAVGGKRGCMQSRLVRMMLFLVGREKTTISELAERFEVSKKTVERDISRLSLAGIPVRCERGCKGGVLLDPAYRVERSSFDDEEIGDIVLALHLLEGVGGKKRELNVLEKLSAVIPELTHVKKLEFDEYLHIELLYEDPGAGGVVFDSVNAALDKETYLECTVSGERVFAAPLSYVLRPEGLFLYCCTRAGDYRLIPLSSVCDCVVSSVEFDRGEYVPYRKGFAEG